jgi:hypothetical protein
MTIERKHFEILELKPGATFIEIKSSYLHLKKLYSSDSMVLAPIGDDIPEAKREELLEQIETAYQALKGYFTTREMNKQTVTRERVMHQNIPEFEVYSGNALRLTREVLNVELQEIALATGIPSRHLKNVEMERFDLLPPEGYIRIYITKYAEYLSLDAKRVCNDYMRAFTKKKRK